MLLLTPRLLQNLSHVRADDCVSRDDQLRFAFWRVFCDRGFVDIESFLLGGLEDVFERGEGFGKVLGEG